MVCFLAYDRTRRYVDIRAWNNANGVILTPHRQLGPGETFFGHSYEAIKALGDGAFDIRPYPVQPTEVPEDSSAAPEAAAPEAAALSADAPRRRKRRRRRIVVNVTVPSIRMPAQEVVVNVPEATSTTKRIDLDRDCFGRADSGTITGD